MIIALNVFVILLLVFVNGFFVAAEFAFVSVRRASVEARATGGDRRAGLLLSVLTDLNAYLSASQFGITLASLALGWLGEPTIARLLETPLAGRVSDAARHAIALVVAFVVITALHIVLGEQAPKLLGLERAERVALASAAPMQLFYRIFRLPVRALDWASAQAVRTLGLRAATDHGAVPTGEELRQMIEASHRGGHIKERERQLLERIFKFTDAEVRAAMVPRTEVLALSVSTTLEEARAAFRSTRYSRLPVYRERLDEIVGLLFRKDLDMGQVAPAAFSLERLARPATFIPATATLGAALTLMQAARVHFVFVLDEYGGLEGIVTLEDLLEEIVGEIEDEFDDKAHALVSRDEGCYLLEGALTVRDANERLNLSLPEDEGYNTLAGFLMAKAGRVLNAGETVEHEGARFIVERVEGLRIRRVRLIPAPRKASEATTDAHAALPFTLALPLVCASLLTELA
jgi:CBS domain containing-hemolysin-like protein